MEELKKWLINNHWFQHKQKQNTDDLLALAYLQPLLRDFYLPFSNSSMRPFNLMCILNDVLINRRNSILEFGSGISTILFGRLISQHNLNSKLISFDHDKDWIDFIQGFIEKESLTEIIKIIHAPLTVSAKPSDNNDWYNEDSVKFTDNLKFDMVIIDGPPAWEPQKKEARYPAFPFIKSRLAENSVVYLDDAEREGERLIVQKWEKEFNVEFRITGGSLAYFIQGCGFNPIIEK